MGSWGRHSGGLSLGCCYKAWSERVSFSIFTTKMVDVLEAQQWRNRFAVETGGTFRLHLSFSVVIYML